MGTPKPEPSASGIVDLSNNADWQARLEDARARRAVALAKAGKSEEPKKPRRKPWEDVDPDGVVAEETVGKVDFHERMRRYKNISRIAPPMEKTPEEMAASNRLLYGTDVAPGTAPAPEDKPERPEPPVSKTVNIFADPGTPKQTKPVSAPVASEPSVAALKSEAPPVLELGVAARVDPVPEPVAQAERGPILRGLWFLTAVATVAVGWFVATAHGYYPPALFWDATPPALAGAVDAMDPVSTGAVASGFVAPDPFGEADQALRSSARQSPIAPLGL